MSVTAYPPLNTRLPGGQGSLRQAAWAGLQDSMPRAALLSLHARIAGVDSATWEDPSLVQLWGPRYSVYVVAKRDYEPVFSGKHDNSVLGVANKDYDAAAIANEVMVRMFERNVVDKAKIRTIYKSETFPTTSYGMAYNLDPKLQEKIKEAFFTFPLEGSALKAEFKTEDRFVPITYQKDWSVVRKIDAASGVKYSCK